MRISFTERVWKNILYLIIFHDRGLTWPRPFYMGYIAMILPQLFFFIKKTCNVKFLLVLHFCILIYFSFSMYTYLSTCRGVFCRFFLTRVDKVLTWELSFFQLKDTLQFSCHFTSWEEENIFFFYRHEELFSVTSCVVSFFTLRVTEYMQV